MSDVKVEQLRATIARVRAVHRVSTLHDVTPGRPAYCVNCLFAWPCPTTTALGSQSDPAPAKEPK